MVLKCEKCGKQLVICQVCKGNSGAGKMTTCKVCRNTGLICPEHDSYWKK